MNTQVIKTLGFLFLLVGCSGGPTGSGNPAAPPAPLSELPSFLRFPQDLSQEFDTSAPEGAATGTGAMKALVMEGEDISSDIEATAQIFTIFAPLVDEILNPLHELLIPVRSDLHFFEDLIVLGPDLVNVKIDFTVYDENGDGVLNDCSGHTAALPICYRIWFDGKRALSGIFLNTFPTELNSGDGRFRGLSPVKILGVIPFATSVSYDVRDPADKFGDYFIAVPRGVEDDEVLEDIPKDKSEIDVGIHIDFDQLGPNATALKTVRGTAERPNDTPYNFEKRIGRWKEDGNLWSGSLDNSSGFRTFTAACAELSGTVVNRELNCIPFGIDVGVPGVDPGAIDFLDFLEVSDLAHPAGFDESPTF